MRYVLCAALLWLGGGDERPPLQAIGEGGEMVFDHDTFADVGFEKAVRQALGQPQGVLAEEALVGLEQLEAGDYAIADLQGIERLRGLEELMLGDNQVTDLAPLEGLLRLQVLDLSNNQIVDLTPLANLLLLNSLNLDGNQVSDLSPLSRLTLLRLLNLDGNQVGDVSLLSRLRRLRSVELSGNPLDITQIVALRDLGDMALSAYLAEAYQLAGVDFREMRPRIDALKGHVVVLPNQAFDHVTQDLTVASPLRWVGTFSEERARPRGPKLRSTSAEGRSAGTAPTGEAPKSRALLFTLIALAVVVLLLAVALFGTAG